MNGDQGGVTTTSQNPAYRLASHFFCIANA
jgi:hypothetical protein